MGVRLARPDSSPVSFELTGDPSKLAMPALCAHCVKSATDRLPIERSFRYKSNRGGTFYSVQGMMVPFCRTCIERHDLEARTLTRNERVHFAFKTISAWFAIAFALCTFYALQFLLESYAARDYVMMGVFTLITMASASSSFSFVVGARRNIRRLSIIPPTTITRSVDFTDNIAGAFEPRRHRYTLRNPTFAQALFAANQDKLYSEQKKAHAAYKRFIAAILAIGAVILAVVLWILSEAGALP
jgi:hypothetical protein